MPAVADQINLVFGFIFSFSRSFIFIELVLVPLPLDPSFWCRKPVSLLARGLIDLDTMEEVIRQRTNLINYHFL